MTLKLREEVCGEHKYFRVIVAYKWLYFLFCFTYRYYIVILLLYQIEGHEN